MKEPITLKFADLFDQFEQEAKQIPPEEVMAHKTFARRELHPLILCSPITHRSYSKPLGFAGDYEMIAMTLGISTAKGSGTYANTIHNYFTETNMAFSNRNRSVELQDRLHKEAKRVVGEERIFTVINIGCGPALELRRFIRDDPLSNQSSIHIMDFNQVRGEATQSRSATSTRTATTCGVSRRSRPFSMRTEGRRTRWGSCRT